MATAKAVLYVIVRPGTFHVTCAYMGAIGKYIQSSVFEEILLESGICASGSIAKVMQGKHYNRALCVHNVVTEALECLLMEQFETNLPAEGQDSISSPAQEPSREALSKHVTRHKVHSAGMKSS